MKTKPEPGERVKMTGTHLANTGQIAGGEGLSVWTVKACDCGLCKGGRHVLTDEPKSAEDLLYYTAEEIEQSPGLKWRHIAFGNLMPESGPGAIRAEYFEIHRSASTCAGHSPQRSHRPRSRRVA